MSKENSLKNLYSVWGSKPLGNMFNGESVQFYSDLSFEEITSDEYMDYARKQNSLIIHPTGTKFKKFGMEWEIISTNRGLYYSCVCKDSKTYEFRDFTKAELEGVEFY